MEKVTNFDIVLKEAIDYLYDNSKVALANLETMARDAGANFKPQAPFHKDGEIPFGISRDWSKAQPSLREVGMEDELVSDLLKRFEQANLGTLRRAKNGDWIMESLTWGTEAPDFSGDTGDSCCFTEKFTMKATGDATPVRYLCFKDCENRLDRMMKDKVHFKQGDLINKFQKLGMSYAEAEAFMAWYTFAFIVQRHIVQGLLSYKGNGLRPFHGVAEMMTHPGITPIDAAGSVIGAFRQVACYLDVLQSQNSNYKIYVHPLTLRGIKSEIKPGKDAQLPEGWDISGDTVTFRGIKFGTSYHMPYDNEVSMTGEAYVLDLNRVEALTQHDLFVPQDSIRTVTSEDDTQAGCEVICDKYENFGLVYTNSPVSHLLIANIPLDQQCPAVVFERIQGLLTGLNPFPMATIKAEA